MHVLKFQPAYFHSGGFSFNGYAATLKFQNKIVCIGIGTGLSNTTDGANTTGGYNAFFGDFTGINLASGDGNTFVGAYTAQSVTTGNYNSVLGNNIAVGNNLTYASAIGVGAAVNSSDTIVLGKSAGTYNGVPRSADTVQIPDNLNITGNLTGGGVVKSINGLNTNVTFAAGANITITPTGNTLTIASIGDGNFIQNNPATEQAARILTSPEQARRIFLTR